MAALDRFPPAPTLLAAAKPYTLPDHRSSYLIVNLR